MKVKATRVRTFPYVGIRHDGTRELFRASSGPTEELYGSLYVYVVGPFRTVRGANFMRLYGKNNPHCQCVSDAERLAKKQAEKDRANKYWARVNVQNVCD